MSLTGGDVPRETSEPEPPVAALLFGSRLAVARQYADDLLRIGAPLGLIGPTEPSRLWSRHLINCALVAPLLGSGSVADVGSGAGLPGLVLAIIRPDIAFTLIEPMERRADWLRQEIHRLGLENVEARRARAEDVGRAAFDQVTARAVSNLAKLIPLTAPLLRPAGELVLMKGARIEEEITAARREISRARLRDVRSSVLGEGMTPEVTRVFRATVG